MMHTLPARLAVFASFLLLGAIPSVAFGQTSPDRLDGLQPSRLQTVYVLDNTGAETSGKLLGLNPDSLLLLVDGAERHFDITEVARIQTRDSLRNGTVIGAIVGIAMGLVAAGISDCPGVNPGRSCAGFRAGTMALSVGTYTGLGAGIDALIRGRSTLYAAPPGSPTLGFLNRASARAAWRVALTW